MSETNEQLAPSGADAHVEDAPATIDDTLSRAFETANADGVEVAEGRARDENGRFVGDAPVAGEGEAAAEEVAAPETEDAAKVAEPSAQPVSNVPEYLAPYAEELHARGMAVERAIPYLMEVWRSVNADPRRGISWLAGTYGLKVNFDGEAHAAAAQTPAQQQSDEWVDPAIAQLRAKVESLEAQQAISQEVYKVQQEAAYRQVSASVKSEVDQFESSKKGDGVDFNVLRPLMAAFIGTDENLSLEQAYQMAVGAHPTTRATREAALRKEGEAEAAKKLEAARRASAINVRGNTANSSKPRSIDDTLARAFESANAGG